MNNFVGRVFAFEVEIDRIDAHRLPDGAVCTDEHGNEHRRDYNNSNGTGWKLVKLVSPELPTRLTLTSLPNESENVA